MCVATFAWTLCACGEVDIIDHDPLLEVPEGNFPQAAEARCGALPANVPPIDGLTTAWAMTRVPVKQREAQFRVSTSSLVLRLSDDGVPCEGSMEPLMLGCPSAWGVDVVLRNTEARPGVFPLHNDSYSYGQSYALSTAFRVDGECEGEQHQGVFEAGHVELFAVTDECVVGRLVDTADTLDEAGASVEGGFVALRCDPDL